MDASLSSCLEKIKAGDVSCLHEDAVACLRENKILVDSDIDIYRSIKLERSLARLDASYLSLTIAPTTACNFNCVYCYESGIAQLSAKKQSELLADTICVYKEICQRKIFESDMVWR